MKATKFRLETKPNIFGIESPTVWYDYGTGLSTFAYIRKAKHIKQSDFDSFMAALTIALNQNVLDQDILDNE